MPVSILFTAQAVAAGAGGLVVTCGFLLSPSPQLVRTTLSSFVLSGMIIALAVGAVWLLNGFLARRFQLSWLRRLALAVLAGTGVIAVAVTFATTARGPRSPRPSALDEKTPPEARVFLIGLDGADWRKIDQLIAAGRLSTFESLLQRGTRARLRTSRPTISPILWTSIATGMGEDKHGIHGFTETPLPSLSRRHSAGGCSTQELKEALPPYLGLRALASIFFRPRSFVQVPVTSSKRRVKALWNIFSDLGLRVGVVNWFATWPSEEVNGHLISDNNPRRAVFFAHRYGNTNPPVGVTYPPELIDDLALGQLPQVGEDIDEILALPFFAELRKSDRDELREQRMLMEVFRVIYLSDAFTAAAGIELLKRERLAFLAIYLSGIDNVSHRFGHRPGVVEAYYEFVDQLLGHYLEYANESTSFVIVSDHGWDYEWKKRWGHAHAPDGILLLSGSRVRENFLLSDSPSIFDVTPTVLGLMSLPSTKEMDGRPIREAFKPASVAALPAEPILSYGGHIPPALPELREDSEVDDLREETIRKLKALGYID